MKMHAMICPQCKGELEVEDGLDTFYCKYCGAKVVLEGQSAAAYRAKSKVAGMKHDEKMYEKKLNHEKFMFQEKEKSQRNGMKMLLVLIAICTGVAIIGLLFLENGTNKEEEKLQALVDEINIDIENDDYDDAYVKAQSIRYTYDDDDELQEKWDATRRAMIDKIVDAEIEDNGKATHEREKEGIISKIKNAFN